MTSTGKSAQELEQILSQTIRDNMAMKAQLNQMINLNSAQQMQLAVAN